MCLSPKKVSILGKCLLLPCGLCIECLNIKHKARVNLILNRMARVKVKRGGVRL